MSLEDERSRPMWHRAEKVFLTSELGAVGFQDHAVVLEFWGYGRYLSLRQKPCLMCATSVNSSRSLGYTWRVHTIQSRRFSAGIRYSNCNSIFRYIPRPSHGGHAVGVRGFWDGPKFPGRRQVAGADPTPGAAGRAEQHQIPRMDSPDLSTV